MASLCDLCLGHRHRSLKLRGLFFPPMKKVKGKFSFRSGWLPWHYCNTFVALFFSIEYFMHFNKIDQLQLLVRHHWLNPSLADPSFGRVGSMYFFDCTQQRAISTHPLPTSSLLKMQSTRTLWWDKTSYLIAAGSKVKVLFANCPVKPAQISKKSCSGGFYKTEANTPARFCKTKAFMFSQYICLYFTKCKGLNIKQTLWLVL